MNRCDSGRFIFAFLWLLAQTTSVAGQPGPQFVWLEPWGVHPSAQYCFADGGDDAAVAWAFGKESTQNEQIRGVGASSEQGKAEAFLKVAASVPGGTHVFDPRWIAICSLDADRTFRLSDSPFGWKVSLEGLAKGLVATGADDTTNAVIGAWAGVVNGTDCPAPLMLALDFEVGGEEINCNTPDTTKNIGAAKNGGRLDVNRADADERIVTDGNYTVLASAHAHASGNTVGFGNTGHGFASADFFAAGGFQVAVAAVPLVNPERLINLNDNFPRLLPKDVTKTFDSAKVCAPGYDGGTFTIDARFANIATDEKLSGLVFRVKSMSAHAILCNADYFAGGEGATLVAAPRDDYADGALGHGEYFHQIFKIGLKEAKKFTFSVDLLGVIDLTESAPALIQSSFGVENSYNHNLEFVAVDGNQLRHWWRDSQNLVWHKGDAFGHDVSSAPAFIQSNIEGVRHFEVIYREGSRLRHWFRNNENLQWFEGPLFSNNVASAPALIQSADGNFQVVYREGDHLRRWWRDNSGGSYVWYPGEAFGTGITSAPALIESTFGHLEVVVASGEQLRHYYRASDGAWLESERPFGDRVGSAPALIQSDLGTVGNFEVLYRELKGNGQGDALRHYWRNNDGAQYEWHDNGEIGVSQGITSAPALIQDKGVAQGNFEVIVREGRQFAHYYRKNRENNYSWVRNVDRDKVNSGVRRI